MKCFYCKDKYSEDELIDYITGELGCDDCIEELYGGLL